MNDGVLKVFKTMELYDAIAWAQDGGQALHLHRIIVDRIKAPRVFVNAVDRGEDIAHLFDRDAERLKATARALGVRVVVVEHAGTPRQHIDLCAGPLRRAREIEGTAFCPKCLGKCKIEVAYLPEPPPSLFEEIKPPTEPPRMLKLPCDLCDGAGRVTVNADGSANVGSLDAMIEQAATAILAGDDVEETLAREFIKAVDAKMLTGSWQVPAAWLKHGDQAFDEYRVAEPRALSEMAVGGDLPAPDFLTCELCGDRVASILIADGVSRCEPCHELVYGDPAVETPRSIVCGRCGGENVHKAGCSAGQGAIA